MNPGDRVRLTQDGQTHEGVLMPSTTEEHAVLKLDGGYNVGIECEGNDIEVIESDVYNIDKNVHKDDTHYEDYRYTEGDPTIALISTGGTIASTVDYRTGAVTSRFEADDIIRAVPELRGRAKWKSTVVTDILSENMTPEVWQDLAEAVSEEIEAGADGVVVMHGTDTMQFSASALAFMLDSPVPIVFTGSQRSADRPSSDNVMNAVCAVEAAKSDCAEVLVCMHASDSDDRCALHRGTRVRKNHTSRRDAFETIGAEPLGWVEYDTNEVTFRREHRERGAVELDIAPDLETDVELVKFTPGTSEKILDAVEGSAGLVLEGTGLGHVHTDWIPRIGEFVEDGTTVVMTSQCVDGRVCDRVYDTGRDLLDAGVIEAEDTLPGTAKVKLMWALANAENIEETMQTPLAGECTERSVPVENRSATATTPEAR